MSLVAHYQFLDSSNLGYDSSSTGLHATNTDVTQVTDPERGIVASFNGSTSGLQTIANIQNPIGSSSRTLMAWVKITNPNNHSGALMTYDSSRITVGINSAGGGNINAFGKRSNASTSSYPVYDVWTHVAVEYNSRGQQVQIFKNGYRTTYTSLPNDLNSASSIVQIGYFATYNAITKTTNYYQYFHGLMSDVRLYSGTASGLIPTVMALPPHIPFGLTPYSTLVETTWLEKAEAVSYRVTVDSGSGEIIAGNNITATETVLYNLEPLVSYTFRLYFSLDGTNYILKETATSTTLEDTVENAYLEKFSNGTVYDLRLLKRATRDLLEKHLSSSLSTGDEIIIEDSRLKGKKLTLVVNGSNSTIPKSNTIIFPFNPNDGASQMATIDLSNNTSTTVIYDETTNVINVGDTVYADGDIFVLDGKKVTVIDV